MSYYNYFQHGGGWYNTYLLYVNSQDPVNAEEFLKYLDKNFDKLATGMDENYLLYAVKEQMLGEELEEFLEHNKFKKLDKAKYPADIPKNLPGNLYLMQWEFKRGGIEEGDFVYKGAKKFFKNAEFISLDMDPDDNNELDLSEDELKQLNSERVYLKSPIALLKSKKISGPPGYTVGGKKCNPKLKKVGKLCNPATGRWIKSDGKIGKNLVAKYGLSAIQEYSNSMK